MYNTVDLPIASLPANLSIEEMQSAGAVVVPLNEVETVPTLAMLASSPSSQVLSEYVVTLNEFEDLDQFYDDMESQGGSLYIPNRRVEVADRRPISRNTHYMLTAMEAMLLQNDPRVHCVELTPEEQGLIKVPVGSVLYTQSGNVFSKSGTNAVGARNWALLRNTRGSHIPSWGTDTGQSSYADGTITRYDTGKNVDVVICDGWFDPSHPEFQWNSDGTGGSRVVSYNWFALDPIVKGTGAGTYVYNTSYQAHGTHVAGIAAGNRNGWAREANIYCLDPLSTNPNGSAATSYVFNYLQAFHKNKSINPATGRKNPTVANHSWGYSTYLMDVNYIASIVRRGSTYSAPSANTLTYLVFYGGQVGFTTSYSANALSYTAWQAAARNAGVDADINDCAANGVITVAAAGNSYGKQDVPGGQDYDNSITMNASAPNNGTAFGGASTTFYTRRGMSPAAASNVICVGNLGTQQVTDAGAWANTGTVGTREVKSASSETGPRIDIWAPGENIMSAAPAGAGVADDRNGSFGMQVMTGTSMASPQVTGYAACILSQYPNMTQAEMKSFITTSASQGSLGNTNAWGGTPFGSAGGYPFDWLTDPQGATTKVFWMQDIKPDEGVAKPLSNYKLRPADGAVYPRPRRTHYVT